MTASAPSHRRRVPCAAALLGFAAALAFPTGLALAQSTAVEPCPAQAPSPASPATQTPSASTAPGSISGFVTDPDGDAVNGATVTLTTATLTAAAPPPRTTNTAGEGAFTFTNVPPGPFALTIDTPGYAPCRLSGQLAPGDDLSLPAIPLAASTTTNVQVTASQAEIAQAQVQAEEKQRVLGAFPNFFVSYEPDALPLTPRQKFSITLRNLVDPISFALIAVQAGAEQAGNVYAWGRSPSAYGKRYAAAYGTFLNGNLLGDALLPSLFHQDPRYFYKGTGTTASRIRYALASSVICRGDNRRKQFNYSGVLGSLAASGISNAYYPAVNRSGAALTFENAAVGLAANAASSLLQEFLIRHLTPHLPPPGN
ncbi:MAG TPA: carboxypeptidase-like regulatory domain-containing protein [Acidobacteriaceae bacterium]|nr:carboxypeptidase-like regulatory domain-containing protein [Acidobacteriaceae bacterium]